MDCTGIRRGAGRMACAPAITLAATAAAVMGPTPDSSAASSRVDSVERRIVWLINRERKRHGAARVSRVRSLSRAADRHSRDMLGGNFFAHSSRDGTPAVTRVLRYRRARRTGETLAYLHDGVPGDQARKVVAMWLASPGHRAVLLDRAFRRIGVGRRGGYLGGRPVTVVTADLQTAR